MALLAALVPRTHFLAMQGGTFIILPQSLALPDISFHFPYQGHGSRGPTQILGSMYQ